MKKVIIGLSVVVILAVVVVLFTNSRTSSNEGKKAVTEMSKDCCKSASTANCEMGKAKDTNSDVKEAVAEKATTDGEKPCCKEGEAMKKGCEETTCPMKAKK
jgi:hypothetical protein